MNKRKVLIIIILAIVIIGISIYAFASKKQVEYDKNGIPLLHPGEDISDEIEDGTHIGIVVEKSNSNVDYEKEKIEFDNKMKNNESIINESDIDYGEEESEVDPFNAILQKYIGKEKVNELYTNISREIEGKNKQNTSEFSKSQNELFDLFAQMLETNELTADEEEILKEGLKVIDVSKLSNLSNQKTVETIKTFMTR